MLQLSLFATTSSSIVEFLKYSLIILEISSLNNVANDFVFTFPFTSNSFSRASLITDSSLEFLQPQDFSFLINLMNLFFFFFKIGFFGLKKKKNFLLGKEIFKINKDFVNKMFHPKDFCWI